MVFLLSCAGLSAQTPVANRVHAAAKSLSRKAGVVAKYTDNRRHCLYFTENNRLFCFDVLKNRKSVVNFTTESYDRILASRLSPDGNFIFLLIEGKKSSPYALENNQTLWKYDSMKKKAERIGEGFGVSWDKKHIIIKKVMRCLNPYDPPERQRWMARNYHFDLFGKNLQVGDEYPLN